MLSGAYDTNTPGGRLNTFRPLDPATGEQIFRYLWAEMIGISKDALGYVLNNTKNPGMEILNIIDSWLLNQGYGDDALRWWRLGGADTGPSAQATAQKKSPLSN
jgi:hypothetical protein